MTSSQMQGIENYQSPIRLNASNGAA
uniref:Uncharacterized protein n=1 Tax=Anguilla anguilla TaxID=7936 RepID=A0A0E9PYK9_ANGAN